MDDVMAHISKECKRKHNLENYEVVDVERNGDCLLNSISTALYGNSSVDLVKNIHLNMMKTMSKNLTKYNACKFIGNLSILESGSLVEEFARLAAMEDGLWLNPNSHVQLLCDTLDCNITVIRPLLPIYNVDDDKSFAWDKEDITFMPTSSKAKFDVLILYGGTIWLRTAFASWRD